MLGTSISNLSLDLHPMVSIHLREIKAHDHRSNRNWNIMDGAECPYMVCTMEDQCLMYVGTIGVV